MLYIIYILNVFIIYRLYNNIFVYAVQCSMDKQLLIKYKVYIFLFWYISGIVLNLLSLVGKLKDLSD